MTEQLKELLDIVLKILALVGGLFGGIPRIYNYLNRPFVKVTDIQIRRVHVEPKAEGIPGVGVVASMGLKQTELKWNLYNHKKWCLFGKDVLNIITNISIYNINTKETFISKMISEYPMISVGQKAPQELYIQKILIPDGKYVLTFIINSGDERITLSKKTVQIDKNEIYIKE